MKDVSEMPVETIDGILIDYATYCCEVLAFTFIAFITIVAIDGGKIPVSTDAATVIYGVGIGASLSIIIGCYPFAKRIIRLPEELK